MKQLFITVILKHLKILRLKRLKILAGVLFFSILSNHLSTPSCVHVIYNTLHSLRFTKQRAGNRFS